uniref:LON peptidase N-terminal domain and RING finger protein 3 isoform X1 n=1 Tax=Ciona intestinalis TaxID=7719 RepID=UPI000180D1E1|nr:LON peptidase N-terminal domain and RING finger protein 3 isoform X1 [Ciona intestinalis]|eukprot:XP_009858831.1 LON peptidase N-terminal domain and RING finger protein 3 isoform X1 [Ciona intestinalis]
MSSELTCHSNNVESTTVKNFGTNSLVKSFPGSSSQENLYRSGANASAYSEFGVTLHHIAVTLSAQSDCLSPVTVDILIDIIMDKLQSILSENRDTVFNSTTLNVEDFESPMDDFACPHCRELLYKPITFLCGHSFCQLCVQCQENPMTFCEVCNVLITDEERLGYSNNVVLMAVFESWHKNEWQGRALTTEGIALLCKQEYKKAIEKFNKALELVPQSHSAFLHRAKANFSLGNYEAALRDATRASVVAHKSPEAYYVKGEILYQLDYVEEALFYFLICVLLDSSRKDAKKRTHEIITTLVSPHFSATNATHSTNKRSNPSQNEFPSKRNCLENSRNLPYFPVYDETASSSSATVDYVTNNDITPTVHVTPMTFTNRSVYPPSVHAWSMKNLDVKPSLTKSDTPEKYEAALEIILKTIDDSSANDLRTLRTQRVSKDLVEAMALKPAPKARLQNNEELDDSDLECSLCMRLLCDPVCTPCGHMFCQGCIERCLDHKSQCPLCKKTAKHNKSLEALHSPCCYVTKAIIRQYLPEEYAERELQHKQEIDELTKTQPIFVSTIAYPSVPCPLHIFEPRYMLMLRRCLDYNDREFGMCMRSPDKPHHDNGTTLRVKNVKFFPDGRSVVDSVGNRRFVTKHSQKRDGYHVATLKFIEDTKIRDEDIEKLTRIVDKVYDEAREWFSSVTPPLKQKITLHFGDLPTKQYGFNTENGPDWLWWVLAVLPVEDTYKASIVGKNNLQERLLTIHKIFVCLQVKSKKNSQGSASTSSSS